MNIPYAREILSTWEQNEIKHISLRKILHILWLITKNNISKCHTFPAKTFSTVGLFEPFSVLLEKCQRASSETFNLLFYIWLFVQTFSGLLKQYIIASVDKPTKCKRVCCQNHKTPYISVLRLAKILANLSLLVASMSTQKIWYTCKCTWNNFRFIKCSIKSLHYCFFVLFSYRKIRCHLLP